MKDSFALIRTWDDGTMEFTEGIKGKDSNIPGDRIDEYNAFWKKEVKFSTDSIDDFLEKMRRFLEGK